MWLPVAQGPLQEVGGSAARQRLQCGDHLGSDATLAWRVRRRRLSQNRAIATCRDERALEPQLQPALLAGIQLRAIEQGDSARRLGRADEQVEPGVLLQLPRCAGDLPSLPVE